MPTTHSIKKAREAAQARFDLAVFDGSALPFEENASKTRYAVTEVKATPPCGGENNLQFRLVTEAAVATLLRHCSRYSQDLIAFVINTGFRLGEILKLKWDDVAFEHCTVRTLILKTQPMIDVPLNDKSARGARVARYPQTGVGFLQPGDGWQREGSLALISRKPTRKANLRDVSWHTFRHMIASRLAPIL
jgi:integrase